MKNLKLSLRKPEPPLGNRGAMGLGLGWIDISGSIFLHVLLLVLLLVLLNKETKKATIWPSNKLHGQNLWQTSLLPLQTICARLSAKTPASLDLQIGTEIEESAWGGEKS